jgi:hypothetical protein
MLNLYTEESLAKEGFLAPFQKQFHLIMDWIYFSFILNPCLSVCCTEIGKLMLIDKLATKNTSFCLNNLFLWTYWNDDLMLANIFIVIKVTYVHDKMYIGSVLLHNEWRIMNYNRWATTHRDCKC